MLCQIDTSRLLCQIAIAGLLLLPAVFASCPCQQLLPAASAGCPCQQLRHGAQASNISATAAPLPVAAMPRRSLQQHLCHGAPASYKPHPAEKSTTVRLAIWRIWAGFANSQLRCANFSAFIYIYASILIAATLKPLIRQTQICRPICTDCLRHLRISAR